MILRAGARESVTSEAPNHRGETDNEGRERVELPRLRHIYAHTARWWVPGTAFRNLRDSVYPLRWLPDGPNSVLVHGAARSVMAAVMATVLDLGIRAEVLATDPALGSVQLLADAGWVCIGTRPFMLRWAQPVHVDSAAPEPTSDVGSAGAVVELTEPADLKIAEDIAADAFGHDPDPVAASTPARQGVSVRRVWGLFHGRDMVSCATTVQIGDTVALWNVATRTECQRLGYGKTLLSAIHARCANSSGTRQFLLSSSNEGYRLYESLDYETIAWWQAWSRPRWALAAS